MRLRWRMPPGKHGYASVAAHNVSPTAPSSRSFHVAAPIPVCWPWKMRFRSVPASAETSQLRWGARSEEHTSELPSLMRISYAVFCLKTKRKDNSRSVILFYHTKHKYITNHKSSSNQNKVK